MKKKITLPDLRQKKENHERIVMLTAYDTPSARLVDEAGVDVVLVGDSLGDNVLGYENTIPVTMEEMIHHTRAVKRGLRRALLVADMPFMSFQCSWEEAVRNAGRLIKDAGAEAVKIEGGAAIAETVQHMTGFGIPVMGHLGLTPQSVNAFGGYRVQGRDAHSAERIMQDAALLQEAGAFAVVLELTPAELAGKISKSLSIPTIGIGSGPLCDGQVLVFHDMLGINPDRSYRHVKRYAELGVEIRQATERYASEVRDGKFPTEENSF